MMRPGMTINLQTLKCGECGGGELRRTGLNQYECAHCGSVSVVEDDVSDRLDRVLDQVQRAAAERLAAEEAARRRHLARIAGYAAIGVAALAGVVVLVQLLSPRPEPARRTAVAARTAPQPPEVPPDSLALGEAVQVLAGAGSSARPRLFVLARNQGPLPLARPSVTAVLRDAGGAVIGERRESLPLDVLMPGESAPLLFDLPTGQAVAGQALRAERLEAVRGGVSAPALRFARVRLVQQDESLRLVGLLAHPQPQGGGDALAQCEVLAMVYDGAGAPVGFGRGHASAGELPPGARTAMDVRIERFGNRQAPIAAWDYRIGCRRAASQPPGGRAALLSADRVVRTEGGPEPLNARLRVSTEELLAVDDERFDPARLELGPLVAGRDTVQRPVYLAEIVNRSQEAIALAPAALITHFNGARAAGETLAAGPAMLYPGERFPLLLDPGREERITATHIEWKPMRRAALPGARPALEVQVTGTRADTSSVLVNFSRRYTYRYAEVSGTVRNTGSAIVRKPVLWVSLRDREGRLTGFTRVDNLGALAPGESLPFQAKVDQRGRDFATVSTLYDAQ